MKRIIVWVSYFRGLRKLIPTILSCLFSLFVMPVTSFATESLTSSSDQSISKPQDKITLSGTVTDAAGEAMPGVYVLVKGTTVGTITNIEGEFTFQVAPGSKALQVSFIGYSTQEIAIGSKTEFNITLEEETTGLEEVVIVGYGVQKKESVVGAITQAKGEDLLKSGGVTSVEEALQGKLPGVTTMQASGVPGESDLKIYIRGQSSWNGGGQPLVLVDGVERDMADVDMNEIDNISVLKDASATAVFGVKGGNGVILITTKRGQTGKAQLSLSANTTIKMVSKLPTKLDAYDGILQSNNAIMYELANNPEAWSDFTPLEIADKHRNPASEEESYIYPNVNWEDVTIKDFAQDFRANLSVRGGSDFAKYFGSLSYQSVSDIINGDYYDAGNGYSGAFKYDRFNYRTNIDFKITNSTKFSVNLSGYVGIQEKPGNLNTIMNGVYEMSPDLYTPVYPDGKYGQYKEDTFSFTNPLVVLNHTGYDKYIKYQVSTDFKLEQKLDFITEGLTFKANFSLDNYMQSQQELQDPGADGIENVVYRIYDGENEIILAPNGTNDFDYVIQPWYLENDEITDSSRKRTTNYDLSLFYQKTFAEKHNLSALLLFKRTEYAKGNMFKKYHEDWVSRLTYNYKSTYFLDMSGAYNGSENFGEGYRFGLFPSAALGWMISNESFMSEFSFLDKLKVRGSYGQVGSDPTSNRWAYASQWTSGGTTFLVPSNIEGRSPYTFYQEDVVGNPDLQWETSTKSNIGVEFALWRNSLTAEFDYFQEKRDNIIISGSSRSIPDFFGIAPPDYNGGEVKVKGYELVLGFNHEFRNGFTTRVDFSMTHAKDKVIFKDDPVGRPFYQRAAGYPMGQQRAAIPTEVMQNWDDVYMSTPKTSGQESTRVGYYDIVDFDGDGEYNSAYDNAPFGYPTRPQNTYNWTFGLGYKGINVTAQFYAAQNSSRKYSSRDFTNQTHVFYEHNLDYWSKENSDATETMPAWEHNTGATDPYNNWYDASLVRLKMVEMSYQFPKDVCEKMGLGSLKVFVNGNNLFLWSDMPDDREFNSSSTSDSDYRGDYPTMKRYNLGLNVNF